MSNLIAIAYPDLATAQTVATELGQLTKEKSIVLDDMVIIEHRPDGKIKLHQSIARPARARPAGRCGAASSGSSSSLRCSAWRSARRRAGPRAR